MFAISVIVSAAGVLLHFVLEMDTEARQQTHLVATIGRLAEQFRRDVHQTRGEPVVAADHRTVDLRLPGGTTVQWRIDEQEGIVRSEHVAGGDREDSFALPKGTTAKLELQPQGAATIVSICIDSPGTGGPAMVIEALASRNGRLAVKEEKP